MKRGKTRIAPIRRERDCAQRIKDLRAFLDIPQEEFATKVGSHRPKVYAWETGRELPSAERLIQIGDLAEVAIGMGLPKNATPEQEELFEQITLTPDSRWFWEKAGLNVELIQNWAKRELASQSGGASAGNISYIERISPEELVARHWPSQKPDALGTEELLPFPSLFLPASGRTFCTQASGRVSGVSFGAGDLVLISEWDRHALAPRGMGLSGSNEDDLPRIGVAELLDRLVGILFKRSPNRLERPDSAGRPTVLSDLQKHNELERGTDEDEDAAAANHPHLADALRASVLFGRLRVQSLKGWLNAFDPLPAKAGWRLFLDCEAYGCPLTAWNLESLDRNAWLSLRLDEEKFSILGPVIGHLRAPRGGHSLWSNS